MAATTHVATAAIAAHAQTQTHAHAHMAANATYAAAAAAVGTQKMWSDDELQNREGYYEDVDDHDLEVPEQKFEFVEHFGLLGPDPAPGHLLPIE